MKHVTILPNALERDIRAAVERERRTGKLEVNFHQGTATGGIQWVEPAIEGSKALTIKTDGA